MQAYTLIIATHKPRIRFKFRVMGFLHQFNSIASLLAVFTMSQCDPLQVLPLIRLLPYITPSKGLRLWLMLVSGFGGGYRDFSPLALPEPRSFAQAAALLGCR